MRLAIRKIEICAEHWTKLMDDWIEQNYKNRNLGTQEIAKAMACEILNLKQGSWH